MGSLREPVGLPYYEFACRSDALVVLGAKDPGTRNARGGSRLKIVRPVSDRIHGGRLCGLRRDTHLAAHDCSQDLSVAGAPCAQVELDRSF